MRTIRMALALVVVVLLCGCTIKTGRLREGMTMREVGAAISAPASSYSKTIGDNRVDVWDYEKETLYVPNPLDDYWSLIPPSTEVARLWFLNGTLKYWQKGKCSGYQAVCNLEVGEEWGIPPRFDSPSAPSFLRGLAAQGR